MRTHRLPILVMSPLTCFVRLMIFSCSASVRRFRSAAAFWAASRLASLASLNALFSLFCSRSHSSCNPLSSAAYFASSLLSGASLPAGAAAVAPAAGFALGSPPARAASSCFSSSAILRAPARC
jgi:hypothetical protein